MKKSKLIVLLLSLAMTAALIPALAFADETDKTYKYVALGDSTVTGYGLEGYSSLPHYGLFMTDMAENGFAGSYPMLFGDILSNSLRDSSYTVETKNLGQCGYTSDSLLRALRGDTQMSAYEEWSLGRYFTNAQELLDENVELLNTNLADADLISIGCGFNDMSSNVILPMLDMTDNPLVVAYRKIFVGTINGAEVDTDAIMEELEASEVTEENIDEFVDYIASIPSTMQDAVNTQVANEKAIVEEVESRNPDAKIALISMYSPYGVSESAGGKTYDAAEIAAQIAAAIVEVYDSDSEEGSGSGSDEGLLSADAQAEMPGLEDAIKDLVKLIEEPDGTIDSTKFAKLFDNIYNRLSYILSYDSMGSIVNPYLQEINEGLKDIADNDPNVTYVDIWNVPNETDSDPHLNAEGHVAVADFMRDTLLPELRLEEPEFSFADVRNPSAWFYDNIYRAVDLGLIKGYNDSCLFGVDDPITRAQAAMILWRYFEPEAAADYNANVATTSVLSDIEPCQWYTGAANWAASNGIISGYDDGRFGPNDKLTREQLCTIVARIAAKYAGADVENWAYSSTIYMSMPDKGSVSKWAAHAVAWCMENGIITGRNNQYIAPGETCTRAETVTILLRTLDKGFLG